MGWACIKDQIAMQELAMFACVYIELWDYFPSVVRKYRSLIHFSEYVLWRRTLLRFGDAIKWWNLWYKVHESVYYFSHVLCWVDLYCNLFISYKLKLLRWLFDKEAGSVAWYSFVLLRWQVSLIVRKTFALYSVRRNCSLLQQLFLGDSLV